MEQHSINTNQSKLNIIHMSQKVIQVASTPHKMENHHHNFLLFWVKSNQVVQILMSNHSTYLNNIEAIMFPQVLPTWLKTSNNLEQLAIKVNCCLKVNRHILMRVYQDTVRWQTQSRRHMSQVININQSQRWHRHIHTANMNLILILNYKQISKEWNDNHL